MNLTLTAPEIDITKTALGYADKAYAAAAKACERAQLATLHADGHVNQTAALLRAILAEAAKAPDARRGVEFPGPQREVMRVGLQLMLDEVEKTQDREDSLGIDTTASQLQILALKALAARLGEQLELRPVEAAPAPSDQPELSIAAVPGVHLDDAGVA